MFDTSEPVLYRYYLQYTFSYGRGVTGSTGNIVVTLPHALNQARFLEIAQAISTKVPGAHGVTLGPATLLAPEPNDEPVRGLSVYFVRMTADDTREYELAGTPYELS